MKVGEPDFRLLLSAIHESIKEESGNINFNYKNLANLVCNSHFPEGSRKDQWSRKSKRRKVEVERSKFNFKKVGVSLFEIQSL